MKVACAILLLLASTHALRLDAGAPIIRASRGAPAAALRRRGGAPAAALRLRGGADAAADAGLLASLMPWLRALRAMLFPGNPPRERAPAPPAPPAPPPAAMGGASGVNRASGGKRATKGGAAGSVMAVHSKADFDKLLASAKAKQLVVVDFHATWCGPCKEIAPKYAAMAGQFQQAKFLKVDVDECKDVAQQYGVKSMPTFKLFKAGKEVDSLSGADDGALREMVTKLAGKPDKYVSAGSGRTL